jgi:hypothetical protein
LTTGENKRVKLVFIGTNALRQLHEHCHLLDAIKDLSFLALWVQQNVGHRQAVGKKTYVGEVTLVSINESNAMISTNWQVGYTHSKYSTPCTPLALFPANGV